MINRNITMKKITNQPFVTYTFLGLQIFIYLLGLILPNLNIEFWGSMSRQLVVYFHQYWRFITPIFIHFGLEHILFNSIVLLFMGRQIEMLYGHLRYIGIYLLGGIMGNAFSFAMNGLNVFSAGSSTSIMGLFGAFLVFGWHFRSNPAVGIMMRNFSLFIIMTFASSLFMPSVSFSGHLGGLIGGTLVAAALALPNNRGSYSIHLRITGIVLFIFLTAVCIFAGIRVPTFYG